MTSEPRHFARSLRARATPAEHILWQALRGRRFRGLKFRRQVPLSIYTVDFLCLERKLVIELDGVQHDWHGDYDRERTMEIEAMGFAVLRLANSLVLTDLDEALGRIGEATRLAAASPFSRLGEGQG